MKRPHDRETKPNIFNQVFNLIFNNDRDRDEKALGRGVGGGIYRSPLIHTTL